MRLQVSKVVAYLREWWLVDMKDAEWSRLASFDMDDRDTVPFKVPQLNVNHFVGIVTPREIPEMLDSVRK